MISRTLSDIADQVNLLKNFSALPPNDATLTTVPVSSSLSQQRTTVNSTSVGSQQLVYDCQRQLPGDDLDSDRFRERERSRSSTSDSNYGGLSAQATNVPLSSRSLESVELTPDEIESYFEMHYSHDPLLEPWLTNGADFTLPITQSSLSSPSQSRLIPSTSPPRYSSGLSLSQPPAMTLQTSHYCYPFYPLSEGCSGLQSQPPPIHCHHCKPWQSYVCGVSPCLLCPRTLLLYCQGSSNRQQCMSGFIDLIFLTSILEPGHNSVDQSFYRLLGVGALYISLLKGELSIWSAFTSSFLDPDCLRV